MLGDCPLPLELFLHFSILTYFAFVPFHLTYLGGSEKTSSKMNELTMILFVVLLAVRVGKRKQ